ncbi:MAG: glycosyltransferase family 1 protein [Acidimicrobiales bacterium]
MPRVAAVVEQCWHRVPGGTATSTVRTLDAIARRGNWDVVGVAAHHRESPSTLATPTIPVVQLPLGRRVLYESWHRFRRPALGRWVGPVDVVHATGGVVPPPGRAALAVTVHDLAFLHRPEHFTRHGVSFMTRSFDLARATAGVIMVPSQVTADDCAAHGVAPDRIVVVPWGVAPAEVTDPDRERVRRTYGLPDTFVLWVGSAEPRKNLPALVEAVRRVDGEVPLVLAGPAGWGIDVEEIVAPTHVRHIGQVPADDLAVLFDLASVFALPSLLEGFGMPVLEAMAQGTAVVTSAGTSTEEIVGDAGVVVDPTDVDALAAAIGDLLGDDRRRAQVAQAGRRRAESMTWDRTAERTEAAYERARG